jgi:Uma2 family endonuclease
MTTTPIKSITLDSFLKASYIDDSPAYEYLNGEIKQKPIPRIHHSRLQLKLASKIDQVAEPPKIALAFPELRCNFGCKSIVPDISVLLWNKIPINETGESEEILPVLDKLSSIYTTIKISVLLRSAFGIAILRSILCKKT